MRIHFPILALLLAVDLSRVWCQSDVCTATEGKDGHLGKPGRDGRPGQKGDCGEPGAAGQMILEVKTSKGDAGDPGSPGQPGDIGYKGPEGLSGPPGDQGLKGSKGAVADMKEQSRPVFSATRPTVTDNVLVFNQIITSEGNIYNINTGKFTCTDPGYYYFTFQVVSAGDLCLYIWAKRGNDAERLLSFCDRNARNQPQVNSGGTVLSLSRNDMVWIQTDDKRKIATHEMGSVFSGFLLFPHNE